MQEGCADHAAQICAGQQVASTCTCPCGQAGLAASLKPARTFRASAIAGGQSALRPCIDVLRCWLLHQPGRGTIYTTHWPTAAWPSGLRGRLTQELACVAHGDHGTGDMASHNSTDQQKPRPAHGLWGRVRGSQPRHWQHLHCHDDATTTEARAETRPAGSHT